MVEESGIPVTPILVHRSDFGIKVRKEHGGPENVSTKMKQLQPICYETFQKMHAAEIKLANHPSGVAEPSHTDETLTQALKQVLALVNDYSNVLSQVYESRCWFRYAQPHCSRIR